MIHSKKFQRLYMDMALFVASKNTSCGSRKVGCVIVDSNNRVKGIGYNGPPAGTPHCDDPEYLTQVVWPKLTFDQLQSLRLSNSNGNPLEELLTCKGCPRRFLGYKSGEATHICSCQHAESNAILNAACDLTGCAMYITTPPCTDCTGKIIQTRIAEVHYPASEQQYSPDALFLLNRVQVVVVEHTYSVSDQDKT